jgi:hypothetical protein
VLAAARLVAAAPAATAPTAPAAQHAGAVRAQGHEPASAGRSRSRDTGGGGGGARPPRPDAPSPPPPSAPGAAGASGSSGGPGPSAGLMAALVGGLPLLFPSFFTRLAGAAVARRQEPAGPRLERPG